MLDTYVFISFLVLALVRGPWSFAYAARFLAIMSGASRERERNVGRDVYLPDSD